MTESNQPVRALVQLDLDNLPDPVAANFFAFSSLGGDIAMQVGWLNIPLAAESSRPGQSVDLKLVPNITHQFMMSRSGFQLLYRQINELVKQMKTNNTLPENFPQGDL